MKSAEKNMKSSEKNMKKGHKYLEKWQNELYIAIKVHGGIFVRVYRGSLSDQNTYLA